MGGCRRRANSVRRSLLSYHRRLGLEPLEERRLLALTTVTTLDDTVDLNDGVTSLREAIFAANTLSGADTIEFAPELTAAGPATILLTQGELAITDSLTINGPRADLLTIDAQQQSRIFHITAATGDFTLSAFTVTGGLTTADTPMGSNLWCGGAIRSLTDGMLTLDRMVFTENGTTGIHSGGGAVFTHGELTLIDSVVKENYTTGSTAYGGAVSVGGDAIIRGSVIRANSATGSEIGAINGLRNVTLIDSLISQNIAKDLSVSAAILAGQALETTDSDITGNTGAGASVLGDCEILQSTISGNSLAGINLQGVNLSVVESAITGNRVGIRHSRGTFPLASISIVNSIVAGNLADGAWVDIDGRGAVVDLKYSLIGDASGTTLSEAPVGSPDANGNLIGGPVHGVIDAMLGPLADNGGPVFLDGSRMLTHALLAGSPATDAGDPLVVAGMNGVPEYDQRGMPWSRVVNGDDVPEARIDIGAVEWQLNPLPGDYNFNGVVDVADYTVWRDTLGSTNDLRADGTGPTPGVPHGLVDGFDYAFWKSQFGNVYEQGAGSRGQGAGSSVLAVVESNTAGQVSSGTQELAGELRLAGSDEGGATGAVDVSVVGTASAEYSGPARRSSTAMRRVRVGGVSGVNAALLAWVGRRERTLGGDEHADACRRDLSSTAAVDPDVDSLDAVFAGLGGGGPAVL